MGQLCFCHSLSYHFYHQTQDQTPTQIDKMSQMWNGFVQLLVPSLHFNTSKVLFHLAWSSTVVLVNAWMVNQWSKLAAVLQIYEGGSFLTGNVKSLEWGQIKSRAANIGGLMSIEEYILKTSNILPTQTIPLRQIWPEDMVFAIIQNPHIYSMFKSVYKRGGYWTVSMKIVQILTS